MPQLLIAYDTTEGQTQKIAERMSEFAREVRYEPVMLRVTERPPRLDSTQFNRVIIGGSIHVGRHSATLERFVIDHRSELEHLPTAFFSVSLSAAGTVDQRADARRVMDQFLKKTGWTPERTEIFAGALLYRDYSFWKRWLMKWIAQRAGGDTDTSKNYEYTDWEAVRLFVTEFLT